MSDKDWLRPVRVRWNDAAMHGGYFSVDAIDDILMLAMESIGFFLRKTKTRVMIATTQTPNKVGDVLVIPAGCLIGLEFLDE